MEQMFTWQRTRHNQWKASAEYISSFEQPRIAEIVNVLVTKRSSIYWDSYEIICYSDEADSAYETVARNSDSTNLSDALLIGEDLLEAYTT